MESTFNKGPLSPAKGPKGTTILSSYAKTFKTWFLQLTPEERARVVQVEDKESISLIRKMFAHQKAKKQYGLFFDIDQDANAPIQGKMINLENSTPETNFKTLDELIFCTYPEHWIQADKKLEEAIQLCDTREYLDTLAVSSSLVEDGESFLKIMTVVCRGGFLQEPCKVTWIPSEKIWKWDQPSWFVKAGYFSLATYIGYKIEQTLWMRFWQAQKLDPRSKQSTPNFTFPKRLEGLTSKKDLIEFWKSKKPEERRKIVGSRKDIIRSAMIDLDNPNAASDPLLHLRRTKQFERISVHTKSTTLAKEEVKKLVKLVQISTEELEMEQSVFNIFPSEKAFIELLYFSPLPRAGSAIDMILRRFGMRIQSAYTEKLGLDLIIGEESEKKQKSNSKKTQAPSKKSKKTKKPENLQTSPSTPPKRATEARISVPLTIKSFTDPNPSPRTLLTHSTGSETSTSAFSTDESSDWNFISKKNKKKSTTVSPAPVRGRDRSSSLSSDPNNPTLPPVTTAHSDSGYGATSGVLRRTASDKAVPKIINSLNILSNNDQINRAQTTPNNTDSLLAEWSKLSKLLEKKAVSAVGPGTSDSYSPQVSEREPVIPSLPVRTISVTELLHDEIVAFATHVKSVMQSKYKPRIDEYCAKVSQIVSGIWPNAKVMVYGSYATGLCLPTSDLDLVVDGAEPVESVTPIKKLTDAFQESQTPWLNSVQCIESARIPVIKLLTKETLSIDITFMTDARNETRQMNFQNLHKPASKDPGNPASHPAHHRNHSYNGKASQKNPQQKPLLTPPPTPKAKPDLSPLAFPKLEDTIPKKTSKAEVVASKSAPVDVKTVKKDEKVNDPWKTGLSSSPRGQYSTSDDIYAFRPGANALSQRPFSKGSQGSPKPVEGGEKEKNQYRSYYYTYYNKKMTKDENGDNGFYGFPFLNQQTQPHYGVRALEFIREKCERYPALDHLSLVVKELVFEKGLHMSFNPNGGVGSYCLVLLVLSFLQKKEREGKLKEGEKNFGTLLIEFFEYFGKSFDFDTTGISVVNQGDFFDLKRAIIYSSAPMVILDPFDHTNNIAYNCIGLWKLRMVFEQAYQTLSTAAESSASILTLLLSTSTFDKAQTTSVTTSAEPTKRSSIDASSSRAPISTGP